MFRYPAVFVILLIFLSCARESENNPPGILVSTGWLAGLPEDPSRVVFHVGTEEVFDSIRIPGSILLDPYEFTEGRDGLRNQVPERSLLDSLVAALGIGPETEIVLVYESRDLAARTARVFVTLDFLGLGKNTRVVNGGLTAWTGEGRSTESGPITDEIPGTGLTPAAGESSMAGSDPAAEVIASAEEVNQFREIPGYVIGDVRSFEEYLGEFDSTGLVPEGGHITGSVFIPYTSLFSETDPHMIKEVEELKNLLKEAGIDKEKTTIYYCGSGIRASVSYLVSRHLGYPVRLYDGSIEDWEERDLPVTPPVVPKE